MLIGGGCYVTVPPATPRTHTGTGTDTQSDCEAFYISLITTLS